MSGGVRLIAAVGRQGQLGLNGQMPWQGFEGAPFRDDLRRFREQTTGGLVLVGHNTAQTVRHLQDTHGRRFLLDEPARTVPSLLSQLGHIYPGRTLWVAGGAKTYARWMPFVTAFDVTVLPYDGPADTFMPPILWR